MGDDEAMYANDVVRNDNSGTFYGEEGNDDVWGVNYGDFVQ